MRKKEAESIRHHLLMAVGCVRVVQQCKDEAIRKARLAEIEEALNCIYEVIDEKSK